MEFQPGRIGGGVQKGGGGGCMILRLSRVVSFCFVRDLIKLKKFKLSFILCDLSL